MIVPETFEQRRLRLERERAIRHDALREAFSLSCRNARSLEKIGARCLIVNYIMNRKLEVSPVSQRELAALLNISETSLSERLATMDSELHRILNLGVSPHDPKTLI